MTERSKHARRRDETASRPPALDAVARARVEGLRTPRAAGWVPTGPVPDARPTSGLGPASTGARRIAAVQDRLPLLLRGATVAPTSPAVAGVVAVLLLGLLLGAWLVWQTRPVSEPAPGLQRSRPPPSAVSPSSPAPASLVVHVAGAVRRPGLVRLPAPARVADAVDAAGGPAKGAELASVNLARLLVDGEQLVVLGKGMNPPVAGPTGSSESAASPGGVLDLNAATLEQLDTLPGVGPVLAQRILDWRAEHGRFSSVEELNEVSGIGEATFADLEPLVRV